MLIYENQLLEKFENQRINAYILKLTTNKYMSHILRTTQHWLNQWTWYLTFWIDAQIFDNGLGNTTYHLLPIWMLHLITSLKILSKLTNDFHFKSHDCNFYDVARWWSFHKRVSMSDNDLTKDLALSNVMN